MSFPESKHQPDTQEGLRSQRPSHLYPAMETTCGVKGKERRESRCKPEKQSRRDLLHMPQPWETLVWSSVKEETQAQRKLAFIISRAEGASVFLFNSKSCADSETKVATKTTKMSVVVPIILYLFPVFISNLILSTVMLDKMRKPKVSFFYTLQFPHGYVVVSDLLVCTVMIHKCP